MQPVFFIRPEVRSLPSVEGTILLDLRSGKYFALNSTGSLVWSRLELGAGREEIERALCETFGAGGEVGADLDLLLAGLEKRGLIGRENFVETPRGASLDREECSRRMERPAARPGFREDVAASETPHGASLPWAFAGFAALFFTDLAVK